MVEKVGFMLSGFPDFKDLVSICANKVCDISREVSISVISGFDQDEGECPFYPHLGDTEKSLWIHILP